MASIARVALEIAPGDPWPGIVRRAIDWAEDEAVALRDAVMLLPFAQHLAPARREWARAGGWLPRMETTQTLARSLAPGEFAEPSQISFDVAVDRLIARRMLRSQNAVAAWSRRDPRGFDQGVAAVVQTAHAIARAAAATAPAERVTYWQRAREWLALHGGRGAIEPMLARVALEWAAAGTTPATDVLYALKPSAWIVVQVAGADPLCERLLAAAAPETPCLWIDADVPLDDPFAAIARHANVKTAVCADFEDEAQRTAALVLGHVGEGVGPVALIAQDRLLVRRVRALLSRRRLPMLDETGWKLSTTRSGASVVGLLRAARAGSSSDDWLDWLKGCAAAWPRMADAQPALASLEQMLRRKGWVAVRSVNATLLADRPAALWRAASDVVHTLNMRRTQPLPDWLAALRQALQACGSWQALELDDAGSQALAALHLHAPPLIDDAESMTLEEFSDWVDDTLEEAAFRPELQRIAAADAPVVITPLERAILRPFAAVVFAGSDEKRLGAPQSAHPLLSDALATALGIATSAARRDAETLAFVQLLRCPNVTLLRRVDDAGEPLAASPLLQRLNLAMAHAGRGNIAPAADPMVTLRIQRRSVPRPLPAAPSLLPARLSASACEALRACPYRFFALRMLSLQEAEELDDNVEKRDYGSWLHKVLLRFHIARSEPRAADADEEHLHRIALEVQQEMAFDDAAFLPYSASFARFVPRYLEWLHVRDRKGMRWLAGELDLKAKPAPWTGVEMHGVIDRVDSVPNEAGSITQLIDYKTVSVQDLRDLQKPPQEDTQLAFYAALIAQPSEAHEGLAAMYLALDDNERIKPIEHKAVAFAARQLIEGIGRDLARLRDGATMPALGEGRTCDICAARGLCRRDHWAAQEEGG